MKKILFIIMVLFLLMPFCVTATTNVAKETAGGYDWYIKDGIYYYEFGDGTKLSFPYEVRAKDIFFNFLDVVETDIPKEKLTIDYEFDIETSRDAYGRVKLRYKDVSIWQKIYLDIGDYIYVPETITVNNYEFDLWNYIKTNLPEKNQIEIIGEYDLNNNGKYALLIKWNDIIEKTIIYVDIEDNKEVIEKECPAVCSNDKEEKETICPPVQEKVLTYETKNYVSNYYTYNTEEIGECSCPEIKIPTPINKIIYSDNDSKKIYYYISYAFYGLAIILLSIFVVRKK